ncbi:putative FMNH2-dependent monooxygenase [Streptomyces sp. NBRC 110611]|uniref:acyl-CoA dehydrogenase family protein n=1 Tax=Streptomyces sp. NBRC 110611 TaxID=1621259 RepID=UPI000830C5D8|nr:acyl-CoA dehydrogenase family protein [Streptomyces sp. NBRC 110611]GAU70835.1 putative FMNH2-dependent monooxygenase [Streptomyces sp. NBRC 110611]
MRPTSDLVNSPPESGIWRRVTREIADDLAVDALPRDRAGKPPYDEVARLREAGLPARLLPPGPPGRGAGWQAACAVIREISAADSSLGELLARHYVLSWSARLFGTAERAEVLELQAAEGQWLWGGSIDVPGPETEPVAAGTGWPGTGTGSGPETGSGPPVLTPVRGGHAQDGYLLDGRRSFPAGVAVADRLVLGAVRAGTGAPLIVLVDPAHPGVLAEPAHDRLGQRLAGAGTVGFDGVPVRPEQVLGAVPREEHDASPFTTLAPLALRLALVHVALGIAEGTLAEARDVSRTTPRAWPPAETAETDGGAYEGRPGGDPYLLLAYGELVAAAHTAAAVVEPATEALARGLRSGHALGVEERADIAVLVAAAEAVTHRSVMHITTRVLELTDGTGAPAGGPGFDRFWRNARVLTAQSSPAHRLRDIGDHYLNGTRTPLTLRI